MTTANSTHVIILVDILQMSFSSQELKICCSFHFFPEQFWDPMPCTKILMKKLIPQVCPISYRRLLGMNCHIWENEVVRLHAQLLADFLSRRAGTSLSTSLR
ncbi:hypothetical protein AAHA92_24677 [Salvia divinorum]|uniref:Uncharacterized protein n=1 Tax=Salvia divinorum TaxID=28513 RepID=A0ABD1G866_SALDI